MLQLRQSDAKQHISLACPRIRTTLSLIFHVQAGSKLWSVKSIPTDKALLIRSLTRVILSRGSSLSMCVNERSLTGVVVS